MMLENPSNAYGFQEEEFKQVVKDVGKHSPVNSVATLNEHSDD